ncbi:hypothetical protein [Nodularia sphaerocarpa]|nr:hypothetical protein [Nodularia sphaerocarpa]
MANATLRGKRSYAVGFTTSSVQVLPVTPEKSMKIPSWELAKPKPG